MTTNKPERTPQQIAESRNYCRKAVAIYLRTISMLIENGSIDAFDLKWSHEVEALKPAGVVIFDSQYLSTPLPATPEQEIQAQENAAIRHAAETLAQATGMDLDSAVKQIIALRQRPPVPSRLSDVRGSIPVEDMSSAIRDAKTCNDPDCVNCKNKA